MGTGSTLGGYVNHNGKLFPVDTPLLRADNRAFRYGWGLYETMLVKDGRIRLGSYHWERLLGSAKQAAIYLPQLADAQYLEMEVVKTVRRNKLEKLARVRLQLYNGNGGLWDKDEQKGRFVIECFPIEEHITELNEAGLTVGIATGVRKAIDKTANFKTSGSMLYAMAATEAKQNKWNDALILNSAGKIAESTIANIFWERDNVMCTTPLSDGCVAGIMRRHMIDVLHKNGIIVHECSLAPEEIPQLRGIFLTNAIRGIRWVAEADNHAYKHYKAQELFDMAIKDL